jgi:hypothetical protein
MMLASMRKQYLHLSASFCEKCDGPVVAGSLAVGENEISKETEIRQVGAICVSCGYRHGQPMPLGISRQFPPVEWKSEKGVDAPLLATAFQEMLERTT